jgi:glutathione peroxidase
MKFVRPNTLTAFLVSVVLCVLVVIHDNGVIGVVRAENVEAQAAEQQSPHAPDTNDSCNEWATAGECEKNPKYMLTNCATSCGDIIDAMKLEQDTLKNIASIYELRVTDIDGKVVAMEQYRNQVVIVINVASYCGYTESHYNGLIKLYDTIQRNSDYSDKITILAFPCNQFGQQEPGSAQEIKQFVQDKGVQFTMMQKVQVNGKDADLFYKYLKYKTNVDSITWNFATYFLIAPDGTITAHTGVQPMELKPIAFSLLKEEL